MLSIIIFFIYSARSKKNIKNKKLYLVSMILFIFLIILTTGDSYYISNIINSSLSSTPIGWFFRSPLKWQLYIPIVYTILMMIGYQCYSENTTFKYRARLILYLIVIFSGVSISYISFDIYQNLLKPKNDILIHKNLQTDNSSNAALIFDDTCTAISRANPIFVEQSIFYFKNKNINLTRVTDVKLIGQHWIYDQFDFIISCANYEKILGSNFEEKVNVDNIFYVYARTKKNEYIAIHDSQIALYNFRTLDLKRKFIKNFLNKDFNFFIQNKKTTFPSYGVKLLFGEDVSSRISKNSLIYSSNTQKNINLYLNKGKRELVLDVVDDEMVIKNVLREYLEVDGRVVGRADDLGQEDEILYSASLGRDQYYLRNGASIFPAKNGISFNENLPVEVYKTQDENVIDNASFESGLWKGAVEDCNNHDDSPDIAMLQSLNSSDGKYAVELQATRHIACTNKRDIPVEAGATYLLSFDYQSDNAQKAGFNIAFSGRERSINEKLPISDEEWRKHSRVVTIPRGSDRVSLHVYSYEDDGVKNIVTRYDNFNLQRLKLVKEIVLTEESEFVQVDLPDTDGDAYRFAYRDENYDYTNLIQNAFLEEGLWQDAVGDCHNYDDDPIIGMRLTGNTSDGGKALELEATRHTACTGPNSVLVSGGTDYLLEFDYQSDNAIHAGIHLGFDDEQKSVINEKLDIADGAWQTYSEKVTVPAGASSLSLLVYSYQSDEKENIVTRYDNFKLIELPDINNRYYLVSEPDVEIAKPDSIEFDLINPTKKLVHISGASKPFYLTMSESYHDKWQLQLNNSKVRGFFGKWVPFVTPDAIGSAQHFKYMTFLNGWYVDPMELCGEAGVKDGCTKNADGSYDIEMVIEFTPQRWFYLGLLISGTTFISLMTYLGYDWYRRRKNIL